MAVGGLVTVLWDTWLAQKVGKAKAAWENKRRRARDEVGDAEQTSAAQDIQPAQELQVQRPEAIKRRAQASASTELIAAEGAASEPGRANRQRSPEIETLNSPPQIADIKTHNISIKLGLSLIAGFLGE